MDTLKGRRGGVSRNRFGNHADVDTQARRQSGDLGAVQTRIDRDVGGANGVNTQYRDDGVFAIGHHHADPRAGQHAAIAKPGRQSGDARAQLSVGHRTESRRECGKVGRARSDGQDSLDRHLIEVRFDRRTHDDAGGTVGVVEELNSRSLHPPSAPSPWIEASLTLVAFKLIYNLNDSQEKEHAAPSHASVCPHPRQGRRHTAR